MKESANFLWLPIVVFALSSFVAFDVKFSLAGEIGNYPGKWYGWFNPYVKPKDPVTKTPAGWAHSEQKKILRSWGYKANDVDEIKELLPEMFYEMVKHPEIWGDIRINETPYIPRGGEYWRRMVEATEKYKGEPYVDEKGWLQNYRAGIPFPGSEDALEIAWNFTKRHNWGSDLYGNWTMALVDAKGRTRWVVAENDFFFYDGRLFDPEPLYRPNPDKREYIQTIGYQAPYDLRGTVPLLIRYDDLKRHDDNWMYLPSLRRVRRMSTAQRWDRQPGGSNCSWDQMQGFQGKVSNYTWRYLGRKEMLCGHNASPFLQEFKGKPGGPPDQLYQRVNTVVIEFTPKPFMAAPISRAVLYLDPEAYIFCYGEYYDKKGRPYIFYGQWYCEDNKGSIVELLMLIVDVQRKYGTNPTTFEVGFNQDAKNIYHITPQFFEMDNLKRYFGGR